MSAFRYNWAENHRHNIFEPIKFYRTFSVIARQFVFVDATEDSNIKFKIYVWELILVSNGASSLTPNLYTLYYFITNQIIRKISQFSLR